MDDFLNKRSIRAKPPSQYLSSYQSSNAELTQALATHLIDLDADGVLEDDWEKFFYARCVRISEALKQRLIARPQDEHGVAPELEEEENGE